MREPAVLTATRPATGGAVVVSAVTAVLLALALLLLL
jgi:hypothetical protein